MHDIYTTSHQFRRRYDVVSTLRARLEFAYEAFVRYKQTRAPLLAGILLDIIFWKLIKNPVYRIMHVGTMAIDVLVSLLTILWCNSFVCVCVCVGGFICGVVCHYLFLISPSCGASGRLCFVIVAFPTFLCCDALLSWIPVRVLIRCIDFLQFGQFILLRV